MSDQALNVTIADGVAVLEMCRPDLLNRIDTQLNDELEAAVIRCATLPEVRVAVLCSTGRVFSAGGDTERMLRHRNEGPLEWMHAVDHGRRFFRLFADFPKPLVAAVHGDVYGLGTSIVLTADAVVAARGVKLADPHIRMGLVAGDGGVVAWPSNMAGTLARRHLLWGIPILAEDAHRIGMVTDLVDTADAVRPLALELAAQVAALPPVAVQLTKRALNKVTSAQTEDAFDLGFYLEAMTLGSEDMEEAVTAFLAKRKPTWRGR